MKSKLVLLLLLSAAFAHAETGEVRIARQFGITFLPLMVMEQQKLVEKHAKAAGIGDVSVKHFIAGTPAAINDAILSGAAHFVAVGPPSFAHCGRAVAARRPSRSPWRTFPTST